MTSAPPLKSKRGLLAVLAFLRPYPGATLACIILLLANLTIEMTLPRIIGEAINSLRNDGATGLGTTNSSLPITFLALVFLRAAIGLLLGPIRNRLVQRILVDIRASIFDAIQRLSFAFHDKTTAGELISRSTADVWRLQDFLFASLFLSVDIAVALLATTVLIFSIHPVLGLLALLTLVPTISLIALFAAKLQPRWREVHDLHGRMTTAIQENIAGVRVVKAFAREQSEVARFLARRDEFLGTLMRAVNYWAARVPFAQFIHGLSIPLALWLGGHFVLVGELSVGALTTTVLYLMAIGHRMGAVGQFTNIVQNAKAAAERVMDIIDTPRPLLSGTRCLPPAPSQSDPGGLTISFENVTFEHSQGRPALAQITFKLPPGATAALVGPTGSGKSTLVSLIPRFREATSGTIRIEGIPIRELNLSKLRRDIGMVFQETYLFSASISQNIAYGSPDASPEQIRAAALAAEADDFITQLPNGYGTLVGERGVSLSGGQRQRIALARAFLCNPRMLILDDATASVDAMTENRVQKAMRVLSRGRTTIIIAHRLSSVQHADRILVLKDGVLVATGTHEELLASNAFYQSLCANQLR